MHLEQLSGFQWTRDKPLSRCPEALFKDQCWRGAVWGQMSRSQEGHGPKSSTMLSYQASWRMMAISWKQTDKWKFTYWRWSIQPPFLSKKSRKNKKPLFKLICVFYKEPHQPRVQFGYQAQRTDIDKWLKVYNQLPVRTLQVLIGWIYLWYIQLKTVWHIHKCVDYGHCLCSEVFLFVFRYDIKYSFVLSSYLTRSIQRLRGRDSNTKCLHLFSKKNC